MRRNYEEVTKDVLKKLFVDDNMKIVDIARTLGCCSDMISKRLVIYGLHSPRKMRKSSITKKDYNTLTQLRYMFNCNYSELAKAYECSIQLVKKHLLIIKEQYPEKIEEIKEVLNVARYAI